MNKSGMRCWAVLVLEAALTACSSPPLGIDGHASGAAGEDSDVNHSKAAANADERLGIGDAVEVDAGTGMPQVGPRTGVSEADGGSVIVEDAAVPNGDAGRQSADRAGGADAGSADGWAVDRPASQADGGQVVMGVDQPGSSRPADAGGVIDAEPGLDSALAERGSADKKTCVPTWCGTHSWACWRMPNSPNASLPNSANYTDMGDGTIRDNVTCLIWQKDPSYLTAYTWADAKLKCTNNPLLGGTGWRLPTRIELISIVDYSRVGPAAVVSVFPSTQLNPPYWTASPSGGEPKSAYMIGFNQGTLSYADQSTMYFARCVRGNGESPDLPITPPSDHYEIGTDEVKDKYTRLVWQRGDSHSLSPSAVSWKEAAAYCQTLNLDGSSWRLPSVKELATLVDESRLGLPMPTIDESAFTSTVPSDYWTSTAIQQNHWTVSFREGTHNLDRTVGFVRCVR